MFGSYTSYTAGYGSYGSINSMASPMDITPSYLSSRSQDHSCAFPSWPRRSSLSESDATEMRATSYLSDEELQDVFEDDAQSVSSAGSASQSPAHEQEQTMLDMQRAQLNYQREMARFMTMEKERRRQQQAMKQRQRRGSSKKSPKNKQSAMTPIAEAE
ncbi:hypothetical protein GQ53DRAFT_802111 [Thozetella sp. PMI_491]|nr:hypothetical protein GQ53DRAFT_802111 [Thozetella sp. PMI_491]